MKNYIAFFLSLILLMTGMTACAADGNAILNMDFPQILGNTIHYSINEAQNNTLLICALYEDKKLCDIKIDELEGEFQIKDNKNYSIKAFLWEKSTMKPLAKSVLYHNLKSGSNIEIFTVNTKIADVISDPVFSDYGRLLFPVNSSYYSGDTLGNLRLTWYTEINPDKTVEIVNYLKDEALSGNKIFYDIYTDEEKAADPEKKNTGLFFFRGNENGKVTILNAGGGFSYVGAMHDSFPHALELSKMGYNAFALIYRPGWDTAPEDLARAIAFIHKNADELKVDVKDYSLWGGSAGARMAAWLGSNGTAYYGEKEYPKAGAVIMQYTGHTEVTGGEPPTYNCVGTNDGIASYRTMENRIERIKANGTDAMIEVFDGLSHGFGLGQETVAEGWINNAVAFWERNMKKAIDIPQTGWTTAVPASYTGAANRQGTVVPLTYDTKDYANSGAKIQKTAYVYLPYGYDETDNTKRYNILYLMHGWGGHAGEYFEYGTLKNMYDHMIENGDMPPTIIVSPSFYNENSSGDFGSSIDELRAFHNDFENDLMPAVEEKYHTYAKSTSISDLKASRDHRAFGGFSLGSVTTWLQFCYDYDYIRYFLPMSGSSWYYGTYGDFQIERNVDFIENLVKDNNLNKRGYFIYHAVGTNDAVKSQSIDMADEMLTRDIFTPEHYVFYQKDGGYHDFNAVQEYLYNALPLFFED